MGFFHKTKGPVLCEGRLSHIAFIMDGNGRWARRRGLPRKAGHFEGAKNMRRIVRACQARGIATVTLYAFSTENWKRPKEEVDAIMELFSAYLEEAWRDRETNRVHVRVLGDISVFSQAQQEEVRRLDEGTRQYTDTLNIALNYGGRQEILYAVNTALAEGLTHLEEEDISARLYSAPSPDPDLIVRTSGEYRTSNFLLWQSAYAEYAFTKTPWPAFSEKELDQILSDYMNRHRRYGGL